DSMVIHPKQLHATEIETYNDHRIAMAFAIAGLRIQGVTIKNPACVKKSFPDFWKEFQKIEGQ
ncbi:MAG TPA: 3-phosphoshikimate 1-carboxyvinyltransferase, partial [Bacteroidota bacterium]|nr:3-phosphoshikimate 1-carboxyvinyltransferase [Bacteroidota bacterium]